MKILIVEDEKKIASFIKRGLSEENYVVDVVHKGMDALNANVGGAYDLIIVDVNLPDIDGFELCRRIRANGYKNAILMLTVRDRVEDKVKGLDSGADDYMTKPFAFEELLARIRALLRKISRTESILKVADLEMDLISHKVRRAGREIELTSKEYALLEYLMRNHDRIVTRTMIAQNVWEIDFDTGTNVIDVFIRYLRKKIDDWHSKKLIHTVRGKGYILRSDV